MPHAAVPVASPLTASLANSSGKSPTLAEVEAVFAAVRAALATYQTKPELPESTVELQAALRRAADFVATFPRRSPQDFGVARARELIREISQSGIHDHPISSSDLALAQQFATQGWPGLLATMLLVPAWQWSAAPALEAVPDWLWGDYTAWLFAAPQGFCAIGQTEMYAAHTLTRLEELNRWIDRNAGSTVVRSALEAYLQNASAIPLYFSHQSLRRHAELRGRLLTKAFVRPENTSEAFPEPRTARKLRVGFVNRHFGPQTETYTTIPTFEQMDPSRFEVVLFAHHSGNSPLETYCRSRAKEFYVLPSALPDQLSMLRAAALDVVVFGTNVTAVCNEVTLLALHRVAPLQVVNNSSCITSGLPEVDLYVSGTLTEIPEAEAHFSERLGLLPGPAHAFNYEADRQDPTTTWTRDALGIPEAATVFVTAANYFKIIPEMQHVWAKLLASVPGSYLVVHPFNPNWSSSYPIQRFCAEFDRVLKSHGVEGNRFVVSSIRFPSRNDVKELLRIGDVYLDTYPFGGVNSLVDPLELGLPVVVWEGETFRSRMGGALLRALELSEFIAKDEASYLAIAQKLASDKVQCVQLTNRILAAMERTPIFLDSLAASDAFGDLMEVSFDELVNVGRTAFRADRTPLLSANFEPIVALRQDSLGHARLALRNGPADTTARYKVGKALIELGQNDRAVTYLLAAVQTDENNAALWYDLALALRRNSQIKEAVQALESSLRMDPKQLEGWLMLAELAKTAGSHDLAREAAGIASTLSPKDHRISAYLNG